jgi:hypothetical protein
MVHAQGKHAVPTYNGQQHGCGQLEHQAQGPLVVRPQALVTGGTEVHATQVQRRRRLLQPPTNNVAVHKQRKLRATRGEENTWATLPLGSTYTHPGHPLELSPTHNLLQARKVTHGIGHRDPTAQWWTGDMGNEERT